MEWGAVLAYGDPTDARQAYLQGLLIAAMEVAWQNAYGLRFISGLSEEQWQQLQGEGLRVGKDLSQQKAVELLKRRPREPGPTWMHLMSILPRDDDLGGWLGIAGGDVLQVSAGRASLGLRAGERALNLIQGDWARPIGALPESIVVRPRDTGSLLPADAE